MVKLLSDPLAKCLCHLVKGQLFILFFKVLPLIYYIVNCAYSTSHLPLLSWHGRIYTHMNQCKIRVWQPYTVRFYPITIVEYVYQLLYGFPLRKWDLFNDALINSEVL